MMGWLIEFDDRNGISMGCRESLAALGNGYLAIRGSAEEDLADAHHYPGTYLAGVYNSLDSLIEGRILNHEDLVNCPNSLVIRSWPTDFKAQWKRATKLTQFALDLQNAVLERNTRMRDSVGRETLIKTKRIVSINDPHLIAINYVIKPINWSGKFTILSGIQGDVVNKGVARYKDLKNMHWLPVEKGFIANDLAFLLMQSSSSRVMIAIAVRNSFYRNGVALKISPRKVYFKNSLYHVYSVPVNKGLELKIEKIISIYNAKDWAIKDPKTQSINKAKFAKNFSVIYAIHKKYWHYLWGECDIDLGRNDLEQRVLRLHIFHLLQTCNVNSMELDCGAPARGWHGEAYRGHIFWDELFIVSFLNLHYPKISRALLMYRYRRLAKARQLAKEAGYKGAMFPWQSASDGSEVSQKWHLNPNTGQWGEDHSSRQRHINCAIAYNVWTYCHTTNDFEFLFSYGAILLIEITRFLVSLISYNKKSNYYEIKGVVGPDEYHDQYPGSKKIGIDNNAYTNVMTVWVIGKTLELISRIEGEKFRAIRITASEINLWRDITKRMFVPFHENIISQFEGYELLKDFKWDYYQERYGNIERLDRILKSENDSANCYKVSKQADVVMLFYLLPRKELKGLFNKLGIKLNEKIIENTIRYYYRNCSHGSTLSRLVYASVLNDIDPELSQKLYHQALMSDYLDTQQGTTKEGIHLGLMAGTAYHVIKCNLGLRISEKTISINPELPKESKKLKLNFKVRSHHYSVEVKKNVIKLVLISNTKDHYVWIFKQRKRISYNNPIYVSYPI